jgi:hypothetical protein
MSLGKLNNMGKENVPYSFFPTSSSLGIGPEGTLLLVKQASLGFALAILETICTSLSF